MTSELVQIEQVYQGTLSKSIWEMDREALQMHLESAAKVPAVGQVTLKIASAKRAPEILVRTNAGWEASSWAPTRHLALSYEPYPGARESLGELTLYGDERVLWARLRDEVSTIIVTQLIQSLLLAGLIMLMFTRLVTVHVQRIASHLGQLMPANLGHALVLNRKILQPDELTLLVTGVNQLQNSLADYLTKQQRTERELAEHRDRLAELVEERTGELKAANARLENLSRTDPLTGLPNRRHFDEVTENEFRRALRTGQPLSLLIADIDFFKGYNDTYGHANGDQCLCAVAGALRTSLRRAGDMVARIGGEEFAVLLPATAQETALTLAESFRQAVAQLAIAHAASTVAAHVTISIGLAVLDSGCADNFDALFRQADQALYRAKAGGRNRVMCAEWINGIPAKKEAS
jgi:diguanylate cyclase (GGDEF)-like protein